MRAYRYAVTAVMLLAASCGGLEHPINDDGADKGNTGIGNTGAQILSVHVGRTDFAVGDTTSIQGTLGGATIVNQGGLHTTSSDSSVAIARGQVITGLSVGSATIGINYSGYDASPPITVSIHAAANGSAAIVGITNFDPAAFSPASVTIKAGSFVQFSVASMHNLVFDILTGAPANIALVSTGSYVARQFQVPGNFTYSCTLHGETGVVHVLQ
jgi:plastocyanin